MAKKLTRDAEITIRMSQYGNQTIYITREWFVEEKEDWRDMKDVRVYESITPASANRLQSLIQKNEDNDWDYVWLVYSISENHCISHGARRGEPDGETRLTTYKYVGSEWYQDDYHLNVKPSPRRIEPDYGNMPLDEIPF